MKMLIKTIMRYCLTPVKMAIIKKRERKKERERGRKERRKEGRKEGRKEDKPTGAAGWLNQWSM